MYIVLITNVDAVWHILFESVKQEFTIYHKSYTILPYNFFLQVIGGDRFNKASQETHQPFLI